MDEPIELILANIITYVELSVQLEYEVKPVGLYKQVEEIVLDELRHKNNGVIFLHSTLRSYNSRDFSLDIHGGWVFFYKFTVPSEVLDEVLDELDSGGFSRER